MQDLQDLVAQGVFRGGGMEVGLPLEDFLEDRP